MATVLLLATDAGRPVYERLGFRTGERYAAFPWPKSGDVAQDGLRARRMVASDLSAVCALDRAATGEDRARFIEALAPAGWVIARSDGAAAPDVAGFHLECPWGGGPIIATDAAVGLALVRLAAGLQSTPPLRPLGVPDGNAAAFRYLSDAGLSAGRYVTRMWLGRSPAWRPEMIFGVFNFAVG